MKGVLERRILLVTGTGGVAKTTVSAALAKAAARAGKRVLCCEPSLEPITPTTPSALATALGGGPGSSEDPIALAPGIDSVWLTPSSGHRRFLSQTLPVKVLADAAMRSTAIRKFLAAAPAFGEMGVLYHLLDLVRLRRLDGRFHYDLCIIDAPATGHALAFAQIPQMLLTVIPGGPIGATAREGLALLTDPHQTGAVVVTLPETLPVSEAIELCAGLAQHKVPLAQVVVNRMPEDPFTPEERLQVEKALAVSGPTFGGRSVQRMDRSLAAVGRLKEKLPGTELLIREHLQTGPALVEKVAAELTG